MVLIDGLARTSLSIILMGSGAAFLSGCGASLDNGGPNGVFQSTLTTPAGQTGAKPETEQKFASSDISANPSITTQKPGVGFGASANPPPASPPSSSTGDRAAGLALAKLTQAQKPSSKAYRVGADDVLEVSVFKVPELSKIAQVNEAGMISFPLIGDVVAAGRTTSELERDLAQKLGAKYLQNPQVSVAVKEYNSQRVLVDGAFVKPGVYPVRGQTTLLQYVANSGGLQPNAASVVLVFRNVNGTQMGARFNIDDIRAGTNADPEIMPGDVIVASIDPNKDGMDKFLKVLPALGTFATVAAVL